MMNPETNRFEEIHHEEELLKAYMRGWKVFQLGEKVVLKDLEFSVVDIQPTKLVLRPYGAANLAAEKEVETQNA